jgi:hypothetical protein
LYNWDYQRVFYLYSTVPFFGLSSDLQCLFLVGVEDLGSQSV